MACSGAVMGQRDLIMNKCPMNCAAGLLTIVVCQPDAVVFCTSSAPDPTTTQFNRSEEHLSLNSSSLMTIFASFHHTAILYSAQLASFSSRFTNLQQSPVQPRIPPGNKWDIRSCNIGSSAYGGRTRRPCIDLISVRSIHWGGDTFMSYWHRYSTSTLLVHRACVCARK